MHVVVNGITDRTTGIAKLFYISSDPSIQPFVTMVISNGFNCSHSSTTVSNVKNRNNNRKCFRYRFFALFLYNSLLNHSIVCVNPSVKETVGSNERSCFSLTVSGRRFGISSNPIG
jgi:hypothetical protein